MADAPYNLPPLAEGGFKKLDPKRAGGAAGAGSDAELAQLAHDIAVPLAFDPPLGRENKPGEQRPENGERTRTRPLSSTSLASSRSTGSSLPGADQEGHRRHHPDASLPDINGPGVDALRRQVDELKGQLRKQNRSCADLKDKLAVAGAENSRLSNDYETSDELDRERAAHQRTKQTAADGARAAAAELESAAAEAVDEQMTMYNLLEEEKAMHSKTREQLNSSRASNERVKAASEGGRRELTQLRELYEHEKQMADDGRGAAAAAAAELQQEKASRTSERWELEKAADRATAEISSLQEALSAARSSRDEAVATLEAIRGGQQTLSGLFCIGFEFLVYVATIDYHQCLMAPITCGVHWI